MDTARKLFDEIPQSRTFCNAVLCARGTSSAYQWPEAFHLFHRMCHSLPYHLTKIFISPTAFTACSAFSVLSTGKAVHGLVDKTYPANFDMIVMQDMEQWMHQIEQWVRQQPAEQLYAAVAVLLVTFAFFAILRLLRPTKSNTIVLAGLSGSGKTVLFYQLHDGSPHQGSVTSMDPNEGTFVLHSELEKKGKLKPIHLVDVPGHSRLRPKLDEFLSHAAGLIFIVDALDFLPNCRAAAEYLYDILTKASIVKQKVSVLILCNKTDKVTAHSKEFIRKQLEKEIDKLRTSRNAISTADIANEYTLGVPGEAFSFSQCRNKVTIGEASGLTGEVSQVEQFIREHVKP